MPASLHPPTWSCVIVSVSYVAESRLLQKAPQAVRTAFDIKDGFLQTGNHPAFSLLKDDGNCCTSQALVKLPMLVIFRLRFFASQAENIRLLSRVRLRQSLVILRRLWLCWSCQEEASSSRVLFRAAIERMAPENDRRQVCVRNAVSEVVRGNSFRSVEKLRQQHILRDCLQD
ncbi:hypothetical protein BU25DRAFT_20388 [Macroventuria anomochaeta]|uniref:Uncharacterized protein n=1 Tax=Macroventuria anomochaeta TaxID=301207 RepID=A0ACB6S5N2_9PLEO|nr:uncharacterized protein BU25DRAFT_20388 [Macroventuria anomochaeta]KAF2629343.1 hypothetical protein BU25DRAFT_20388 [Macroventuria anomochaeta]